jgi:Ca2+-binding EF-hand superfamily protein
MAKVEIVAALLAFTVTGVAIAQSSAPKPDPATRHGDMDGDGVISRAEFLANAAKRFDAMDTNKDGQLTADERKAAHEKKWAERPHPPRDAGMGAAPAAGPGVPPPPGAAGRRGPGGPGGGGAVLAMLDANGDGKITKAEFDGPFDRLDLNHDGVLDETELKAAPQGPGGGRLARMAAESGGKVTRAQYEAPFARVDTNNDGVIDASEIAAVRARMGADGDRRPGAPRLRRSEAQVQPQ